MHWHISCMKWNSEHICSVLEHWTFFVPALEYSSIGILIISVQYWRIMSIQKHTNSLRSTWFAHRVSQYYHTMQASICPRLATVNIGFFYLLPRLAITVADTENRSFFQRKIWSNLKKFHFAIKFGQINSEFLLFAIVVTKFFRFSKSGLATKLKPNGS